MNIGLGTSRCANVSSEIETIALSTRLEASTLFIVGTYYERCFPYSALLFI